MLILEEEEEEEEEEDELVVLRVSKYCPQKLPRRPDDMCCPSVIKHKLFRYRLSHFLTKQKAFRKKQFLT